MLLIAGGAAAATILVSTNVDEAEPVASPGSPSPSPSATFQNPISVEQWVTRGQKLFLYHEIVDGQPEIEQQALDLLLAGLPERVTDSDPKVTSLIADGTELLDLTVEDGEATANFDSEFETGTSCVGCDELRLAQVVYTLTQFPTVTSVAFELDGKPVDVFGDAKIDGPVSRDDYEKDLPPIVVSTPEAGDEVHKLISLTGSANVFEATVSYRLVAANGDELEKGFTTASCGSGCRGTFDVSILVDAVEPTDATLEVFESSAENGDPLHMVRIPLKVFPE